MKQRWLALCTLLLAWPLGATTVERLDLAGLIENADMIVVGTVAEVETYWSSDGRLILTRNRLEVSQTLKGSLQRWMDVTTIGGTIGDITLHVAGMPAFTEGEEAVMFLEQAGSFRTVVGLGQGKFSVRGGMVSNSVSGLEFVDRESGNTLQMPLETLLDEIRRRMEPF